MRVSPPPHTLPPPRGAPRPQQLLPLFCPLCQTRSQNIYKHAKVQTFPRAPERRPSARDPAAVHARVRIRYPSVLLGAPSDVYAPFSPPQSHRVTQPGGDVTCSESASMSEQRQRPDWKVSPPLRVGPSGSAGGRKSVSLTFASRVSQKCFSAKHRRTELYRLFNKTTSIAAAAVDTQESRARRAGEAAHSRSVPLLNFYFSTMPLFCLKLPLSSHILDLIFHSGLT